jgi:hypothetical protein
LVVVLFTQGKINGVTDISKLFLLSENTLTLANTGYSDILGVTIN